MRPRIGSLTATLFLSLSFLTASLLMVPAAGALPSESVCAPSIIDASGDQVDAVGAAIQGSDCADLIIADVETKSIDAGAGDDVVIGASGVLALDGGTGEDTIYANGSQEATGGADDDLIFGDGVPELGTGEATPLEAALMPFIEKFGVQTVREAVESAVDPNGVETVSSKRSDVDETIFVSHVVLAADPIIGDNDPNNLFGGSGHDRIFGRGGNDRLFGNIGDDYIRGENGDDLLSGGQGGDDLNGGDGSDMLRGDGTIDVIFDNGTGTNDQDTISFAGGVTPGFQINVPGPNGAPNGYTNFPGASGERGVYIDLTNKIGDNGAARDGGGRDETTAPSLNGLENIIGSPYADYIVGNGADNVIDGGGGPDVILGGGGNDNLYGNAGNDNITGEGGSDYTNGGPGKDYCDGESKISCNETGTSSDAVIARDDSKVQVGMISRPGVPHKDFYATGSTSSDNIEIFFAKGSGGDPDTVRFELTGASFDTSEAEKTDRCDYTNANGTPKKVVCQSYDRIGTTIVSGLGGNDDLFGPFQGMQRTTTYISLGGDGNDWIKGTDTSDDLLVDGDGRDILLGYDKDDGLINNTGIDEIWLGGGDDLAITATLCDNGLINGVSTADEINGGAGSDNASWAQLPASTYNGVAARLIEGRFGYKSSTGPTCDNHGGKRGELALIENLEGSQMDDGLFGDENQNSLLGRPGEDVLGGGAGEDFIAARANDDDVIDCGTGTDSGHADPWPLDSNVAGCDGNLVRAP
jgi:Ca2+-binding RTX toxin-like protein